MDVVRVLAAGNAVERGADDAALVTNLMAADAAGDKMGVEDFLAGQRRALDGILTFLLVDGRDLDERNIVPPRGAGALAPAPEEAVHSHLAVLLAFKFHFHFGPLIGGLADALGLGGVLQFVHSQKRAVAGALQILGAHPAAEDIVAAALEAYAGKQAGVVPCLGTDAQGMLASAHVFLPGLNRVLEVGTARAVGACRPVARQFVVAHFFKRGIGQHVGAGLVPDHIQLRGTGCGKGRAQPFVLGIDGLLHEQRSGLAMRVVLGQRRQCGERGAAHVQILVREGGAVVEQFGGRLIGAERAQGVAAQDGIGCNQRGAMGLAIEFAEAFERP